MQQHASAAFEQQRGLHVAYLLVTYMHACSLFNSRSPCSSSECMAQCILRQGIIILLITHTTITHCCIKPIKVGTYIIVIELHSM